MFPKIGRNAAIALGCIALGFVVVGVAWNNAASIDFVQGQIPYLLSGGVTALGLIGLGLALLLFEAGRRARGRLEEKLDALIEAVGGTVPGEGSQNGAVAERPPVLDGMVVVGRSSFHRPDCRLVEGKEDLDYAPLDEAVERGLSPCRVCEPTRTEETPVPVETRKRSRKR